MENMQDVESSRSGPSDEIPQAGAASIGIGPNANNNCQICVKYRTFMSLYKQVTHHDELQLERFLLESLPELHFVEAIRDWEHKRDRGLIPSKQTAKTLTLHLLNSFFLSYHVDPVSIGNCHGSQFKNCVVYSAIEKEVQKVFPHADAEFDANVRFWFNSQTSSSEVGSTGTYRAVPKCTICIERLKSQKTLKDTSAGLKNLLLEYYPERPRDLKEMVDGFLVNYILKGRLTGLLSLTKNCFGENFLTERGKELFSIDNYDAYVYAQNWFKEQLKSFEDIKSIAIFDDGQEPDTPNVIKISLPEECKRDAMVMIVGILNYIFKKYYVGFVLSCGVSQRIPIQLDSEIHGIILGTFPELQREFYEDCVKEWFESQE